MKRGKPTYYPVMLEVKRDQVVLVEVVEVLKEFNDLMHASYLSIFHLDERSTIKMSWFLEASLKVRCLIAYTH